MTNYANVFNPRNQGEKHSNPLIAQIDADFSLQRRKEEQQSLTTERTEFSEFVSDL